MRACENGRIVLTTYGRSSGFRVDPVEKKPLNHFLPGTPVLSFGSDRCNVACNICRNHDISNVDLNALTQDFYRTIIKDHLQPVLDTLLSRRLSRLPYSAAMPRTNRRRGVQNQRALGTTRVFGRRSSAVLKSEKVWFTKLTAPAMCSR